MSDRDRTADARLAEIETWAREIGGLGPDQAVRVTVREARDPAGLRSKS